MIWPKYQAKVTSGVTFRHLKHFFSDKKALLTIGNILLLIVIYIFGIHLSLPFVHVAIIQNALGQSTLLSVINELFTGGALGNASPLALGIFPLLFFYGSVNYVLGAHTNAPVQFRLWRTLLITMVLAALVATWFMLIKAIPATVLNFAAAMGAFIAGTLLLIFIDRKLKKYEGPEIIFLNAILVIARYLASLFLRHSIIDLLAVALIALFIFFLVLLIRKTLLIQVINIKQEKVRWGSLPLPATNSLFLFALFIIPLTLFSVVTALLKLFANFGLHSLEQPVVTTIILILIQISVSLVLARNILFDAFLSQFNSRATARKLMVNFWVIPDLQDNITATYLQVTTNYLAQLAFKLHRLTYIFCFFAVASFSFIELAADLHMPVTPLPFGPLGFLIMLVLCLQVGYEIFGVIQRYIQGINLGNFWVLPRSNAFNLQPFLEENTLEEVIYWLLPEATLEERESIIAAFTAKNLFASQKILRSILARQIESAPDVSFGQFLFKLSLCIIIALIFTAIAAWVAQPFYAQVFTDPVSRSTLIFFFFATFVAFIPVLGLDQFFKALLTQVKNREPAAVVEKRQLIVTESDGTSFWDQIQFNMLVTKQREIVETERRTILAGADLHQQVTTMISAEAGRIVAKAIPGDTVTDEEQLEILLTILERYVEIPEELIPEPILGARREELKHQFSDLLVKHYELRDVELRQQATEQGITNFDPLHEFERNYALQVIDRLLPEYIDKLHILYTTMHTGSSSQGEQFQAFQNKADAEFNELQVDIQHYLVDALLKLLRNDVTITVDKPKSQNALS